jgi:hypothetical protein
MCVVVDYSSNCWGNVLVLHVLLPMVLPHDSFFIHSINHTTVAFHILQVAKGFYQHLIVQYVHRPPCKNYQESGAEQFSHQVAAYGKVFFAEFDE